MESSTNLAQRIQMETGQDIRACQQSGVCSAGCPLAEYFDWTPTQIVQAVQFGESDLALESRTLWLCASCQTCTTACPNGVDLALVMDSLAGVARERGIRPKVGEAGLGHKVFLPAVHLPGRVRELGLMPSGGVETFRRSVSIDHRPGPGEVLLLAAVAVLAPLMALGYLLGVLLHDFERRFHHSSTKGV
jgi:heterodisulfide reductase subunit C